MSAQRSKTPHSLTSHLFLACRVIQCCPLSKYHSLGHATLCDPSQCRVLKRSRIIIIKIKQKCEPLAEKTKSAAIRRIHSARTHIYDVSKLMHSNARQWPAPAPIYNLNILAAAHLHKLCCSIGTHKFPSSDLRALDHTNIVWIVADTITKMCPLSHCMEVVLEQWCRKMPNRTDQSQFSQSGMGEKNWAGLGSGAHLHTKRERSG